MSAHVAIALAALLAFTSMAAASERTSATGNRGSSLTAQIDGFASAGGLGSTRIRGN